jgi:hypothetical protein
MRTTPIATRLQAFPPHLADCHPSIAFSEGCQIVSLTKYLLIDRPMVKKALISNR